MADETAWLQMLRDSNQISHLYNEAMARQIYDHIKQYFPEIERTYHFLQHQFQDNHE